jgi:hypothetical protein
MTIHATYTGSRTDDAAIHELFRSEDGPVGRELTRDAHIVLNAARSLVRVRTGRLRETGRTESGMSALGQYRDVVFGREGLTPYLGYELEGTTPHIIRPSRRKVLRFISGGRVIYSSRVFHPGTSGSHFLTRAMEVLR